MNKLRILDTPIKFRPPTTTINPPHQGRNPLIEERFFQYASSNVIYSDLIYIPIFWTQFHINNNYGQNLDEIFDFIEQIHLKYSNEKFFTIVQYDGGTLIPINNCKIFACCGDFSSPLGINSSYEPIPLLSEKHKNFLPYYKNHLASFVGNPKTHKIREDLILKYKNDSDFYFKTNVKNFKSYVFKKAALKSYFTLCPRGFGPSSFRLYEVLGLSQVPVYISDEFWLPYNDLINWNDIALLISPNQINDLKSILKESLENDYVRIKNNIKSIKENYFSWHGCINYILKKIS